jgi:hypothetical protein
MSRAQRWSLAGVGIIGALVLALMLVVGIIITFFLPDHMAHVREQFAAELSTVNAADGISAEEAQALAMVYAVELISGCGGADTALLKDGRWVAQVRIGYAGNLSQTVITIDAKSGAMSSTDGPSFPNVWLFRQYIALGIGWRRI